MRRLLGTLALILFVGCRTQSTAMTNPFLAPDRVPPPATRTLLPGTAQPYYPGDPVPNAPVINAPPAGYTPGATPTYAPQPTGVTPPGGWNTTPTQIPGGAASMDVVPSGIQQASVNIPVATQPQSSPIVPFNGATLPPDPSILPTPQPGFLPSYNQQASYQAPIQPQQIVQQQPFVEQSVPVGEQRAVRIRAISSEGLPTVGGATGASPSRDGFRPQGSSQVRKPTILSRLSSQPRQVQPTQPVVEPVNRFGHAAQYEWLRGQLGYDANSGMWSLRYESSQGAADEFGGNLAIANPQVLGELQPGDYVQLRGQLDQATYADGALAPIYNVSVVQRQRI